MPDRSPLRVVGALCVREGQILLTQRPLGGTRGGIWEFPGGKVEVGETDEAALARELMEEIALPVTVFQRVSSALHDYGDLVVHLLVYHCQPEVGAEPQALEPDALAWVTPGSFHGYDLQGADRLLGGHLDAMGLENVLGGGALGPGA